MSIFGLFKTKNSLEEIKQNWTDVQALLEKLFKENKNEISLKNYPEIKKKIERIFEILITEDKVSVYENTQVLNYFLEENLFTFMTGFAFNNNIIGFQDIFLSGTITCIKELRSGKFLVNNSIQLNLLTILKSLSIEIQEEKLQYNTKLIVIYFLYELCRKFFTFPSLLQVMKIKMTIDDEKVEDILIFSILMNLFKKDNLIKEYKYKKMIRRSLIICLSFEEIYFSKYIIFESHLPEILIEKLCGYFQMIPEYVDFADDLPTLDLRYNILKTFPTLYDNFILFRDYFFFFNKITNLLRSPLLIDKFKYSFFNNFLIGYIQPLLLSHNLKIVRTNLQYLTFMVKTCNNQNIINEIFHFLFGFDDSVTMYLNKRNNYLDFPSIVEFAIPNEKKSVNKITPKKLDNDEIILEQEDDILSSKEISYKINVHNDDDDEHEKFLNDYDYKKHYNIDIGLSILTNMKTNKEMTNIVIFCMLEVFLEKCPFKFVNKLITPFIEVILKKSANINKYFKKPAIDLTEFIDSLNEYEGVLNFNYNDFSNNIENTSFMSYDFYIKNNIDFYTYYVNNKELYNNIEVLDSEFEKNDISKDKKENMIDEKMILNLNKFSALFSIKTGKILEDYFLNKEVKINLQSKIYDEVDDIEEEFNNIYIIFMKNILEKFRNFFNNSPKENLLLCV